MVNNSKKHFPKEKLVLLFILFYEITKKSKNEKVYKEIIQDIISPTEQIMISKRISIIYLLLKNISQTEISEYLHVSRTTVAKFYLLIYGRDSKLVEYIKQMLRNQNFSNIFTKIFNDIFIQPGVKKGHWKLYWENIKKEKREKFIDV